MKLTDQQIEAIIRDSRMDEKCKRALRKQAIEHRNPGAWFQVVGLGIRQGKIRRAAA